MERLKNALLLLIGLAIVLWSFYIVLNRPAPAKYQKEAHNSQPTTDNVTNAYLKFGNYVLPVEIAETDAAREQGLSGRASIESGHGMLFLFETPGSYGFWMKDMRFPIDIVWIDRDWTVVGVERGAAPESFPQIFYPVEAVQYVLELKAGDTVALGIDTGMKLFLDR